MLSIASLKEVEKHIFHFHFHLNEVIKFEFIFRNFKKTKRQEAFLAGLGWLFVG